MKIIFKMRKFRIIESTVDRDLNFLGFLKKFFVKIAFDFDTNFARILPSTIIHSITIYGHISVLIVAHRAQLVIGGWNIAGDLFQNILSVIQYHTGRNVGHKHVTADGKFWKFNRHATVDRWRSFGRSLKYS